MFPRDIVARGARAASAAVAISITVTVTVTVAVTVAGRREGSGVLAAVAVEEVSIVALFTEVDDAVAAPR